MACPPLSKCTLGPSVCTPLLPMSPKPKLPAASPCRHSWLGFVLLHLHWSLLLIRHQSAGFIHTMLDMTASAAINTFWCSSHVQSLIHGMPLITIYMILHERLAMLSCHHSSKYPRVVAAFLGLAQSGHSSVASPENFPGARPWAQARRSRGWPEGFQKGWHPPAPEAESTEQCRTKCQNYQKQKVHVCDYMHDYI